MAVHDGLSRCLPRVDTHIKTHDIGIVSADAVSSLLQELVDGIPLRLMKVEILRDVPFRNNEGVPWRDWVSVIDRNRKLMIR